MKKLLSIILAAALLVGIFAVPVYADNVADDPDYVDTDLYKGLYESLYSSDDVITSQRRKTPEFGGENRVLAEEDYLDMVPFLVERAYHYNENGEIDWLFFESGSWDGVATEFSFGFYCGRFCTFGFYGEPFKYGAGVYDVELGRFMPLHKAAKKERYADLGDLMSEANYGILIGDVNKDNSVDIIDATFTQMGLAGLVSFPHDEADDILDEFFEISGRSDMNRDGYVNIKDVTAVQKCIAKLDYLA